MSVWRFTAAAEPKGQPRARATTFGGGRPRMWTPATADAFKTAVALAAREAIPQELCPIDGPIRLVAAFYLRRPQRLLARRVPREAIPHVSKPDVDNVVKAALDALVQSGIVRDDSLLYSMSVGKYYTEADLAPRAEFWLYTNTDTETNHA